MSFDVETLALDLGGTHTRVARVNGDGSILEKVRVPTPTSDPDPSGLVELIRDISSRSDATRLVVGAPGIVNNRTKSLETAVNLPESWLSDITAEWISERTSLEVDLANDADLAGIGEAYFGAGAQYGDTAYVTISTGVGAGLVVSGKIDSGVFSGGEIGHCIVDMAACLSGGAMTVEQIGSGTAMNAAAIGAGLTAQGADLAALVRSGDPVATRIWDRSINAVGIGVVNLCWYATPDVVVIGGGVGMNSDLVLGPIAKLVAEYGPTIAEIPIVAADLGDDAALAGAAGLWQARGYD